MIHVFIVETYEQGRPYPIVEHRFRGRTKAEALGIYRAHLRSDTFLRQCDEQGIFDDRVPCQSRARWEVEDAR